MSIFNLRLKLKSIQITDQVDQKDRCVRQYNTTNIGGSSV